jgi:hypothetical protein
MAGAKLAYLQRKYANDIFLLPSEGDKVIVQYSPKLTISCGLGAKERDITVYAGNTHTLKVKTPDLLFAQDVWWNEHYIPDCNCGEVCQTHRARFQSDYSLFRLGKSPNGEPGIFVKPYLFANVKDSGNICWGNRRPPVNLRHANAFYWSAPFNMDLWKKFREHRDGPCEDILHECGGYVSENFCAIRHECEARNNGDNCHPGHKCKSYENGGVCEKVHTKQGHIEGKPEARDCKCKCCQNTCLCRTNCLCCMEECDCRLECYCCSGDCHCRRECRCCRGDCGCGCACDLPAEFLVHLNDHHGVDDEWDMDGQKVAWVNMKKPVFGEKYVASPKHEEAVFISSDPEVLRQVPENQWRESLDGDNMVIGFASRTPDGWLINIGGQEINLSEKAVNVCA